MTVFGFYSSSLHVGGGGEKYFLTLVETAVAERWGTIRLLSPQPPDHEAWRRLGIEIEPSDFAWIEANDRTVSRHTLGLDVFVAMTWSTPISLARRSYLLVQFPSRRLYPREWDGTRKWLKRRVQRALLSRYSIICNSQYTARYVGEFLGRPRATVVYPPFSGAKPGAAQEEKARIILSVGRFIPMKRQDVLVEAFVRLRDDPPADGWELHLVGVAERSPAGDAYLERLRAAGTDAVHLHVDAGFAELQALYEQASVFWHAAGYELSDHPELQEHFGLVTVEAMSHGCIPVVFAGGGQPEIIESGVNGVLWTTIPELINRTKEVMSDTDGAGAQLRRAARESTNRFATERFRQEMTDLIP